jgi:hypothetical protein
MNAQTKARIAQDPYYAEAYYNLPTLARLREDEKNAKAIDPNTGRLWGLRF